MRIKQNHQITKKAAHGKKKLRRNLIQKSPSKLANELQQESGSKMQTTTVINLVNQAENPDQQWVSDHSTKQHKSKTGNESHKS